MLGEKIEQMNEMKWKKELREFLDWYYDFEGRNEEANIEYIFMHKGHKYSIHIVINEYIWMGLTIRDLFNYSDELFDNPEIEQHLINSSSDGRHTDCSISKDVRLKDIMIYFQKKMKSEIKTIFSEKIDLTEEELEPDAYDDEFILIAAKTSYDFMKDDEKYMVDEIDIERWLKDKKPMIEKFFWGLNKFLLDNNIELIKNE
ncbi:MAG: hypothetical protein ABII01_04570 [Candidatus Woesearchaeota archaeon]